MTGKRKKIVVNALSGSREDKNISFQCELCPFKSTTMAKIQKHVTECEKGALNTMVAKDKSQFLCGVCNQTFRYLAGLKKHELRHEPPGGFVCSQCNGCFITDADRTRHKETVHKTFKCMICSEKFNSEEVFSNHIDQMHGGRDREYVICNYCGAHYRQKSQLKIHIESKCGTVRSFTCEICDSKFMTQNTLNAHKLIHKGEKAHLCDHCGASFLNRGQLQIHERSHTKEKPYQCTECDKAFAHRESLVTHSSVHTGIKPYMCQCCNSRFSCIGNLIKHRRTRPETCGLPKYVNVKAAPRASTKIPGTLVMKPIRNRKPRSRPESESTIIVPFEKIKGKTDSESDDQTNNGIETHLTKEVVLCDRKVSRAPGMKPNYSPKLKSESGSGSDSISVTPVERSRNDYQLNNEIDDHSTMKIEVLDDVLLNDSEMEYEEENCYSDVQKVEDSELEHSSEDEKIFFLSENKEYVLANLEGSSSTAVTQPTSQVFIVDTDSIQVADLQRNWNNLDDSQNVDIIYTTTEDNPVTLEEMETDYDDSDGMKIQFLEVEPAQPNDLGGPSASSQDSVENVSEFFECDICSKRFIKKKSLIMHLSMFHRKKSLFTCKYCPKTYTANKLMLKHIELHGPTGQLIYKCPCCSDYFETEDKMRLHAQEAHEDRLKCKICDRYFKDLHCIYAHMRAKHQKIKSNKSKSSGKKNTFICAKCGRKFGCRVALVDHEKADCGQSPIYKCNFPGCGKPLHSRGSLKTHQLIHSGDLPFECKFCKKRFRTQGQIKVHERSHSGDKPFKCTKCPKSFSHRESLLTHMSLHTGVKRFMCQCCFNRFSCISNLQAHRRTHKDTCGQVPLNTKAQYVYNFENGDVSITDNN